MLIPTKIHSFASTFQSTPFISNLFPMSLARTPVPHAPWKWWQWPASMMLSGGFCRCSSLGWGCLLLFLGGWKFYFLSWWISNFVKFVNLRLLRSSCGFSIILSGWYLTLIWFSNMQPVSHSRGKLFLVTMCGGGFDVELMIFAFMFILFQPQSGVALGGWTAIQFWYWLLRVSRVHSLRVKSTTRLGWTGCPQATFTSYWWAVSVAALMIIC